MRLTNPMRREIRNKLLHKKFQANFDAQSKELQELAQEAYRTAYPEELRKLMATLPDGWLPMDNAVTVRIDGINRRFVLGGAYPIPHSHWHSANLVLGRTDPLAGRIRKNLRQTAILEDEKEILSRQISSALNSVTTTKKLLEAWPEVAPYVPSETKSMLPAVQTKELNQALGLT